MVHSSANANVSKLSAFLYISTAIIDNIELTPALITDRLMPVIIIKIIIEIILII